MMSRTRRRLDDVVSLAIVSIHAPSCAWSAEVVLEARAPRGRLVDHGRGLAEGAVDLLVAARRLAVQSCGGRRRTWARSAVDDAADRPDEREEEEVLDPRGSCFATRRPRLVSLGDEQRRGAS